MTLEVWHDFVDETLHHTGFKKPRETVRRVVVASNRARAKVPNWPLPELPKLVNPRLVSIPKSDLPASFWTDVDKYVETVEHAVQGHLRQRTGPSNSRPTPWCATAR